MIKELMRRLLSWCPRESLRRSLLAGRNLKFRYASWAISVAWLLMMLILIPVIYNLAVVAPLYGYYLASQSVYTMNVSTNESRWQKTQSIEIPFTIQGDPKRSNASAAFYHKVYVGGSGVSRDIDIWYTFYCNDQMYHEMYDGYGGRGGSGYGFSSDSGPIPSIATVTGNNTVKIKISVSSHANATADQSFRLDISDVRVNVEPASALLEYFWLFVFAAAVGLPMFYYIGKRIEKQNIPPMRA